MAYDENLAERVRVILADTSDVFEKKMFGGLAFLLRGKMFCGILGRDLMVRIGTQRYDFALSRPNVRPMDFTGKPMAGYVYVAPRGCASTKALSFWVFAAIDYVTTLPDKTSAPRSRARIPTIRAPVPRRPKPARPRRPAPPRTSAKKKTSKKSSRET